MKLLIPIACLLFTVFVIFELKRAKLMEDLLPPSQPVDHYEIDGMLRRGYPLVAVLGTGSMRPYIPAGEGVVAWVAIDRCDFGLLAVGDLVVFRTPKGNVVHQLIESTETGWITSGLHNSGYDSMRLTAKEYNGRVVRTYILQK